MRDQFFLIIETQATIDGTVADFGAIVCDKAGKIHQECAVLVADEFEMKSPLHDEKAAGTWSLEGRDIRQQRYKEKLKAGERMLASAVALNRWLGLTFAKYAPDLIAFDLACELDRLKKTGIYVSVFARRFSLRDAAEAHFAQSEKYKAFAEDKSPNNITQESKLHTMASFVSDKMLPPVPNTAIEDVKFYALPILTAIVKLKDWQNLVEYCGRGSTFSKLSKGKDGSVRIATVKNRNPKEVNQTRKLVRKIKKCCPDIFDLEGLDSIEENLNCGAWSWSPILKEVPAKRINRCRDVLNGPIYTCEGYEWPVYKDLPMVPFIQFDLKRCSRVSGVDLGTGLLQIWFGCGLFMGKDAFIRVVPADQVHKDKLLPVPAFHMEKLSDSTSAYSYWADAEYDEPATQIVGYKHRRFTLPNIYVNTADSGIDVEHWKLSKPRGKQKRPDLSEECLQLIEQFVELRKYALENWRPRTHLMGTFDTIQYSQRERAFPLFCFDGEEKFNFGDGNAQIFFEKDNTGKISFYLDWSCF